MRAIAFCTVLLLLGACAPSELEVATSLDRSGEWFPLTEAPSGSVYGYGAELGVTVLTLSTLRFRFDRPADADLLSVSFVPRGIDSRGDVDVTLNGHRIGTVEPKRLNSQGAQRIRIPTEHLRLAGNELVFESVGDLRPWAIAQPRLNAFTLVESTAEFIAEAKKQYRRALEEERVEGHALRAFGSINEAALYLEAVEPKPSFYAELDASRRRLGAELDSRCEQLMKTAALSFAMHDGEKARQTYEEGLRYFSSDEHPCREKLEAALATLHN